MQATNRHIENDDSLENNDYTHEDQIKTILNNAHQQLNNIEKNAQDIRKILQYQVQTEDNDRQLIQQDINNSEIQIYVNNIAGTDKHMRKIEVIINHMKINNIDIFMGQEMNITTKNTTLKKFIRRQIIQEYHVVTSESNAKFASYRKPGGTFCITGPRLKNRIIERITDYM